MAIVIGESIERFIDKDNIPLSGYEASVEFKKDTGDVTYKDIAQKSQDEKQFIARVETKDLPAGTYILRIWVTDTVDDFISIIGEEEIKLVK